MKLSRLLSFIAFVFSCVVVLPVFAEGTTIGEITAASKKLAICPAKLLQLSMAT